MKILRLSVTVLGGAIGWGILCGGSCDGTNLNTAPTGPAVICPAGTVIQGGQCSTTHAIKAK
jgi:hypothetical protein